MSAAFLRRINDLHAPLVLHPPHQESSEKSKEISPLDPELVLRHIPGKSVQWRQWPQGFRSFLRRPKLQAPGRKVLGVGCPPRRLRLRPTSELARLRRAGALTRNYTRIGTKPFPTKPARASATW